jgi:hypothetical protein
MSSQRLLKKAAHILSLSANHAEIAVRDETQTRRDA